MPFPNPHGRGGCSTTSQDSYRRARPRLGGSARLGDDAYVGLAFLPVAEDLLGLVVWKPILR